MDKRLFSLISDKTKFGDLHIHTKFSVDSEEEMENYVVKAIVFGYDYLGFSEHVDFDPNDHGYGYFNYSAYLEEFERIKSDYENKISLFLGVEVDFQSRFLDGIQDFCNNHTFDFKIGSVHWVNGKLPSKLIKGYENHGIGEEQNLQEYYNEYIKENLKMMESIPFDIVGHLDFPKRYIKGKRKDYSAQLFTNFSDILLKSISKNNLLIEINTSNFLKGLSDFMPDEEFVKKYLIETKRPVLISSDSHSVNDFEITNGLKRGVFERIFG